MTICVKCPTCGTAFKAPNDVVGRRAECGKCGGLFTVNADNGIYALADDELVPLQQRSRIDAIDHDIDRSLEVGTPGTNNGIDFRSLKTYKRHDGSENTADADFFEPPPTEVGEILSAETTLRVTDRGWSLERRLTLVVAVMVLCGLVTIYIIMAIVKNEFTWMLLFPCIVPIAAGYATWLKTEFHAKCTYVGQCGIATCEIRKSRGNTATTHVLRFADAAILTVDYTRVYHNYVYKYTSCIYSWYNSYDVVLFQFSGSYENMELIKSGDPYHFGRAAELAWSNYCLPRIENELLDTGRVLFPVHGMGIQLSVMPGALGIVCQGRSEVLPVDQIEYIKLYMGHIIIRSKDARWYSRTGKLSIPYGNLGNARLFLLAVERLTGKRIE